MAVVPIVQGERFGMPRPYSNPAASEFRIDKSPSNCVVSLSNDFSDSPQGAHDGRLTCRVLSKPPQPHCRYLRCPGHAGTLPWTRFGRHYYSAGNFPYSMLNSCWPHEAAVRRNHTLFMNLDDDRLLKVFRAPACPRPEKIWGWYDLTGFSLINNDFHGFIAGHTLGQYVSAWPACAVTGSEATAPR